VDICSENIGNVVERVQRELPGVEVQTLSKDDFERAEFLATYFRKGATSVIIGSSGVGKSTLVNFLIGDEQIKTQDIRGRKR
jgi:ribosome biogenesis GTPase